jgi:hypothetical protein
VEARKVIKAILIVIFAAAACAQTPAPVGDFSRLPSYVVGAGGAYDRYASPAASVPITLSVRIGSTNLYSWTTMDTPIAPVSSTGPSPASLRTGIAYVAAGSGSCFLFLLGDAGIATGSGTTALGAFSGGLGMYCDIGARFKTSKLYVGPVVRAIKVSSTAVQPVIEFMVSKGF